MQQDFTQVAPDFGYWLAGFVDGEGTFVISKRQPAAYWPRFGLALRADDSAVLEMAQSVTGLGRLYLSRRQDRPVNAKPVLHWVVANKRDLIQLVRIFDRYPLRSKKARDYAIWREAVLYVTRPGTGTGHSGQWGPLKELRERLMLVRLYENADEEVGLPESLSTQLTFLEGAA